MHGLREGLKILAFEIEAAERGVIVRMFENVAKRH
jgi:hypothetical protein